MEKVTRSAIERATQQARRLLDDDFSAQLEGTFDVLRPGVVAATAGAHLSPRQAFQRDKIVAALDHKRGAGMAPAEAVADYIRDAAFTTLNRFVALKMLEARELVQECVTRGEQSAGYKEFCGLAPGVALLPDSAGYRLYIESIFDELSTEVKVLFDRRDPASVLWPRRQTFEELLDLLNDAELAQVWGEDETIGWVYQYFNSGDERRAMRDASQAPRNSRELAVRNQFFTPRYVVEFLTDNTLGRIWYEMRQGRTGLKEQCQYMVRRPNELFAEDPAALDNPDPWLVQLLAGDFKAIPEDIHWGNGVQLAHAIRGYESAIALGHRDAFEVAERVRGSYDEGTQVFAASAADLWIALFVQYRAERHAGGFADGQPTKYPDELCRALRAALLADSDAVRPALIPHRAKKDPRDIGILDPACGSGHFLLYAFDLLRAIYEEAYTDSDSPKSEATGETLASDYPSSDALRKAIPGLILAHNLHGVDIDPRCAQIAQLALWMRAQRAYRDFVVKRAERPQIRRSNIVVAEPLVADVSLAAQFVESLVDAELGRVFVGLVDALKLAGDLGLLLRVETLVARPTRRGQTGNLFAPPEDRIRTTLARFIAEVGSRTRRRLFAEDVVQGIGLLVIAEQKFDVLLMNPPFGEPTSSATRTYQVDVPDNLYAWFMLRAGELLSEGGLCGCITDSTWLRQPTFLALRKRLLLDTPLLVLVDLGWEVLDANVRTCMQVYGVGPRAAFFIGEATDPGTRTQRLRGILAERSTLATSSLPKAVLVPQFGPREAAEVSGLPVLGSFASLPWGCGANDSFRLFRLRWEVDWGANSDWRPMTNGGPFSPFYRENYLVCRVAFGSTIAFDIPDADGEKLWDGSAREFIGRAGLTYPKRSELFNVAPLPAGTVVTPEGKGLFPLGGDLAVVCAVANSSLVGVMASFLCGPHKQRGDVALLPMPALTSDQQRLVAEASRNATSAVLRAHRSAEISCVFTFPGDGLSVAIARKIATGALAKIDAVLAISPALRDLATELESEVRSRIEIAWPELEESESEASVTSWLVGIAFGRFDPRLVIGERALPPEPDPFGAVSNRSPGMFPNRAEPRNGPSVLVDDSGHADDLVERLRSAADHVGREIPADLRLWLATEFFALHIKMYSKSRRKAPIYWQLATPSASYSVWLHIHAFSNDTLFRVQNDYVGGELGKLAHEERRLASLTATLREKASAAQRTELAAQEFFVEELRTLLEEVKRVAPLWRANLDDGVIINFAPLWRLVPQNKSWQKELKSTWDALCEGKYDWAHLAMHLWPERVVPKCAKDRSLAIAHGIEDVFWVEGSDGKWTARKTPARPIDELVRERISPAVKAALKSLVEAPFVGSGPNQPRGARPRRRQNATRRET